MFLAGSRAPAGFLGSKSGEWRRGQAYKTTLNWQTSCDGAVGSAIGDWGHQTHVSHLSRAGRRAGQRLGIVSHISRLSRANERNHPAAAKRLWRDSRVLSRLVSRLSRTWQQRFVFCLGVNAHRCSIFRFHGYRAVCAPLCAPCPSCVLLSFAIHDRFFEKPWFYQVTIRSDLGRACTT